MNKQTFIKIVKCLRKQYALEHDFANAMEPVLDGRFVPQISNDVMEAFRLALVSATDEDFEDWAWWWLYDCNGIDKDLEHDWFIRDAKEQKNEAIFTQGTREPLAAFSDGKEYAPRNAEELYEMIELFNDEKG
jgi:hypothetical protein